MARVAEEHYLELLEVTRIGGQVVTRRGYGLPCARLDVIEAGHPIPDRMSILAAERALELASGAKTGDLVLVLLSGGASALWTAPAGGISLEEKQQITRRLLKSGAAIGEINCVRKHLSRIKGGRLAVAAAPANLVTLAVSDVSGDDPSAIGSGPTVPDPTSQRDAMGYLDKHGIAVSGDVVAVLADPRYESPQADHPAFASAAYRLVARPADALAAAAAAARKDGYETLVLGADLEGDARGLAEQHAALALDARRRGKRAVLLSGGEATVRVRGTGRGGPNQELALALACALNGAEGIWALVADSDGTDGGTGDPADPAGATIEPQTLYRARLEGLDPLNFLENNDSTGFFAALGDLLITGPTFTNVNDFRAILVEP